jgi:hypothetical protein
VRNQRRYQRSYSAWAALLFSGLRAGPFYP